MDTPACEKDGAAIVLNGDFNPKIFHPSWLALQKLIREQEAAEAQVEVTSREVAQFSLDWLVVQVVPDRFAAIANERSRFESLLDLVVGVFTVLEHTPVTGAFVIRNMHYRMPTREAYKGFGDMLAPKPPWGELLTNIGLQSQTMVGKRPESSSKAVRFKVERSNVVKPNGIYFESNELFELGPDVKNVLKYVEVLREAAVPSIEYGKTVADTLLSRTY